MIEKLEAHLKSNAANSLRIKKHLIDIESLTAEEIETIVAVAAEFKRLKTSYPLDILKGKHVAFMFYENSTRTKSSFQIAAANLSANVVNLDISTSSVAKGETLIDTGRTLVAMGVHAIIPRHSVSGSTRELADSIQEASIVNAGTGKETHPTQALLDYFTMQECVGSLHGKTVTIFGDTKYSRVARSNVALLKKMGAIIRICSPANMMAEDLAAEGVKLFNNLEEAIAGADFIMSLRIQLERQEEGVLSSKEEYIERFQLNHALLAKASANAKVLHPGPVNRDIELTSALVDDQDKSLIETQVANGIFIRMAILAILLT